MTATSNLLLIGIPAIVVFLLSKSVSFPTAINEKNNQSNEEPGVSRFREYLRIDTSHPNPNYDSAVKWLKTQAEEIELEFHNEIFPSPALFAVRMTWKGSNPALKSIVFNSHIDVVPADLSKWKYHPFEAVKDSNGNIFARGSQDRKSLGVQYMEAVRKLKAEGFQPQRTIHITFVPDEEVGGLKGMAAYVNSEDFKSLNIGVAFDEGSASAKDEYIVTYGEKAPWYLKVIATGSSGHGSSMLPDNPGVKIEKVIRRLMAFREQQLLLLANSNGTLSTDDITSINLTQLGGGIQSNVVPSEFWATFDIRIRPKPEFTFDDMERMLENIRAEAGPGVRYEFIMKSILSGETILDDSNIWWKTLKDIFVEKGLKFITKYRSSATDARYLRAKNYTAFGFSPLPKTKETIHQDNEYLNESSFLEGITMIQTIMIRFTNVNASFD